MNEKYEKIVAYCLKKGYKIGRLQIHNLFDLPHRQARKMTKQLDTDERLKHLSKPRARFHKPTPKLDSPKLKERETGRDTIIDEYLSPYAIQTAEDLADIGDIDLTIWEADKIKQNFWNTSGEYGCYQIKVLWKRKNALTMSEAAEIYKQLIAEYQPPDLPQFEYTEGDTLLHISIADPHVGRLSWGQETGYGNYDLKIACKRYIETHHYFKALYEGRRIDRILITIGNDFFNSNNSMNSTAAGTLQDEDCRYQKTYRAGKKLVLDVIELWRNVAPVDVVFVYGNHDEERLWYLGESIETFYRLEESVKIDNRPLEHKYYQFGKNLLGFTHKLQNYKDANNLLLADARQYLSEAKACIEFHTGHFHNEKTVDSLGNITIRTLPSLAELSSWESRKGYRGLKKAMAFAYDKTGGLLEIRYCNQ